MSYLIRELVLSPSFMKGKPIPIFLHFWSNPTDTPKYFAASLGDKYFGITLPMVIPLTSVLLR